MVSKQELLNFAEQHRDEYEQLLSEFVRIPTVSSDPAYRDHIMRGVEFAVATIKRLGGEAEVIATSGYPVVYGSLNPSPGAKTVSLYGHMDVQPASRETEPWDTEPFEMVRKDGRYFGRGTTDDKGPALAGLFAILAARELGIPLNYRIMWEFEEETGSPNFDEALKQIAAREHPDAVVLSDTVWISSKRPALTSGLRGMITFRFRLKTAGGDRHSGDTGGAARNPLAELMALACEIVDAKTGKVKIPGFYDDVRKLSRAEQQDFLNSGFSVKGFKKDNGFKNLRTEDPLEVMKRLWALPTFEVHGVVGGYQGPGFKAIVPGEVELRASCRLVPDQNPRKILQLVKSFVKAKNPDIEILPGALVPPYLGITSGPLADALKESIEFAFGRRPTFVREGGSIGTVVNMEKMLHCPVLFLNLSLPEHGYHAPNENFDWGQACGGMIAYTKLFQDLSKLL